ncbi:hypothetical protein TCAL_07911, partial [Tigriopus californicus]
IIVRSQNLLYRNQPGRQIDLTGALPTSEVFWLNFEEGYFACQMNTSEKFLKLFQLSRLCDGVDDCFMGSDELRDEHKCSEGCGSTCQFGVCITTKTNGDRCLCNEGFGGEGCDIADTNECRYKPCSMFAECTNTLGSFQCKCLPGYQGDGFHCESIPVNNDTSSDASSGVSDQFGDQDDDNSNVIGGGVGGLFAPAKDGSSNQNEVVNDTLSEISKPVAPSHVPGNTSADQHDDVPSSVKEGGESHGLSANQQPSNRGEDSEKSEDAIVFPTGNLPSSEGNQVRTDTKEDGNHDGGSSLAGDVREDPIVVGFDPNTFEPIFSPKEEPAASTKGPFIDLGLDDPIKALSEILRDKTFGPSEGPDQRTPEKSDSPITINYDLDYEYPELGLSPSSPRTSDQPITILYDLDYDYRENSLDPDFVPETTEEQSSLESSNETIANDQSLPDFIAPEQMSDEPTNTQHPIGQQPMNILPNERKKERVPSVSNSALDFTLNSNNNESEDISNEDALIQPSGPALLPDLSRERPTTEKDTQSSAGESDEISQESLIPETTPKIISDPIRETFQEMVAQDNILKPSTTGPNQEIEETLSTLENTSPEISKSDTDTEFVQNEMKSNPDVDFRTTLVPDHARNRPTEIQSTLDNIMSSTSKPSNRSGPPLNQKEIEAFSSESSFSGSDVAPFDGNNPIPNIGTKATPKENLVPVEEVVFIPEHAGEKPTEVSSSKGSSRVSTMPPFFPDNIQDDNLDQSSTMVLQDDEPGQSQAIDPSTTSGIKQRLNSVKDTIAVGSPDETNLFQGPISKPNLIPDHTKDKPTELVEDVKDSGALNASSNEDAIIEFGDSLSSNEKPTLLPEHALHKPTEFVPSNVHSPVKTFTHDMIKNPGQEPMLIPDHAKGRPTTLFSNGSPTNSFLPSGLEDHLKSNQVSSNEHFIPEHARDKPTEFAIGEIGSPVTENSQSIQDNLNQEQVLLPKEPTTFVPDESSSKTKIGSEDPLKANPENGQEYLIPDHDKDKPTELVPNDANAPVLVTETSHDIQMGSDQEQILIPEHAKENAPIIGPHSFEPPEVLAPQEPMLIPNHEGQEPTKGISKAEIKTDLMTESPDGSAIPPWVSDPSENEPFGGINTPNQPGFSLRPFKPSLVPDHAQERPVEIVSAEVPSTINPQGRPVSNFVPSPDLRKPDVIGEKPTDMSSNNQDQKSPNVNLFEFLASSTPFSRTDEDFPNDEQSNSGNSVTLLYDLDYELDPSDQIQDQFETTSSVLRPAEEAPTSSNPVKVMFQTNNGDKNNQIPHLSIDVDPTLGLVRTTTVASIDQTGVTPEQEEPSENQRATTSRPFEVKFSLPDVQLPYPPSDSNVDISPQFDTNVQISDDNMGNVGLSTDAKAITLTNQGDDSLGIQDETSEPPTRAQLPDQNLLKNPFDPFPIPNLELGVDFDGNGSKEFETKHHSPKVDQGEIRNEGRESFEEDLEVQIPINNYPQFEVDLIRGRVKEATTTTQSQFNGINPRFPLKVHDTLEEHLGVPIPSRTDGLFKDTPPQKTSSDTSSHSGQDSKVKYPLQEHFETSVPHESSNSPTERVQTDSEKSSSNPEMDDLEPFEAQSEELDETNGSQSILDVLQPCSIGYSNCGSGKPIDQDVDQVCQKQFNQCAISRLNTAQTLESDIRNQLINSFQSSPDLLQCILTHQACIVPNKKMCMANFQHCALNALNGISRLTTPSSVAKQAPQPTTPTSTIREGVPQGPTKLDQAAIEELMGTLQQNFTICIQSHTVCLDNGISHAICQHSFKECSLAILVDSKLNETSLFELEEQVEETQDQPLATELYQCIRNFMMCQMSNQNRYCMRDYQKCSLSAMPQKSTSSPRPTTRLPNVPPRRARPSQIHSNPRPIEPALRSPGGFILGPSHGLSHSPPPYIDPSTGILIHSPQFRTPVVPNLGPECQQMGITADFGSFGGRPAQSVADCTWDFFGCTRRRGVWPANKPCCQARFDACCSHVMGTPNGPSHSQSTSRPSSIGQGSNNGGYPPIQEVHTTTRQPTTTTPRPTTTTRTTTVASTSQRPGFDRDGNPVRMIDCIWTYNGCVKRRQKPDSQCKSEFNACSMIAMGMVPQEASSSTTTTTTTTTTTKKPIQDIDLAELPEFLKPPTDSDTNQKPPRPIQDIDLPSNQEVLEFQPGSQDSFQHNDLALNHPEGFGSNEFLSCLLRLHDCEENGITNCRNVQRCKNEGPIFSPIESEGGEQVGSFEPGSGPTDTPDDCKMSFHNCGLTKTENDCRREFSKCSGGSQPDYEICADVAEHPQNYLVPHPEDCTKFYSCQSLGIGKGWIAHLMDCPETTGFDDQLRICNFIRVLPRCQKGESRAFQPYQFLRTFHAKQTRTENILDQYEPQVGYYSTNNVTYSAQSHGGTLNKSPCLLGIVLSFMVVFASKSLSHML